MDSAPGNEIKVAIRVRPLLPKEKAAGMKHKWHCTETMISPESTQISNCSYVFDKVFDENVSNMTVYEELASDIVKQAMIGFNGTFFTYGQSGSGKTYTIDALRTFAIKSAYDYIENCPAREFLMRVSYIELYNEKLMDLLSDDNAHLTIREDNERNVYIDGLKEIIVKSQDHVKDVLAQGNARRTFAETKLNDRSSRAHCIFRVVIESREREDPEHSSVYVSYLNLVDLAGSERAGESSGERLREGVSINLSLLTLSQVIRKLSGEQREYINYRDSKLTRILQNALEGNSKTAILCTVAPHSVEETHSTLRFALNAKKVKTKPQQNEVLTDSAMLKKSQLEITRLKNKVRELEGRNLTQENDELQLQRATWEKLIKEFSSFLCVSSKAREEKRGPERKRRETVCVPQMHRAADVKAPGIPSIAQKVNFLNSHLKQAHIASIPESPPLNDSVFAAPFPLDSPCASQEPSQNDLSFTDVERTIVGESLIEKCNTSIRKYQAEIAALKKKLRVKGGQYVTCREFEPNLSLPSEFKRVAFMAEDEVIEDFETEEGLIKKRKEGLDEDIEIIYEENTVMKSQVEKYQEELENVKSQMEILNERVAQQGRVREDSERTIAELRDKIQKDEEEIVRLKATEEELKQWCERENKKWKQKIKNLEWEKHVLEMLHEEKGLLETSAGELGTPKKDHEEMLEGQKEELLKEWEDLGKMKEELNEQAKSVESKMFMLEEEKDKILQERERIHKEWNEMEKAHNDLRQEKEEYSKEKESVESIIEKLHSLQAENEWLRNNVVNFSVQNNENGESVEKEPERDLNVISQEHDDQTSTSVTSILDKEKIIQQQWEDLKHAQDRLMQEREEFELEKLENRIKVVVRNKSEITENEALERLQEGQEYLHQIQDDLSDKKDLEGEHENDVVHDVEKCMLEEERKALLKNLECLRKSVYELNIRKEVLESEMENSRWCKYKEQSECTEEHLLERSDMYEKERLQEEWESLRKAQNELKFREMQLEEQEAATESKIDKCCMLEETIERLEEELKTLREAQHDKRNGKETLEISVPEEVTVTMDAGSKEDDEKPDLERQKTTLQQEWKKLEKYQAELSRQEENVERKIERLCMLEEEKEQFEEEKNNFLRDLETFKEAQKDFMREQEAFRQNELKLQNKLELDSEKNVEKRSKEISVSEEEVNLLEKWEHLRKAEEKLREEKELFEQEKAGHGEEEHLTINQELLNKEWHILTRAQKAFRIEKEALLEKLKKQNISSGQENVRETEEPHGDIIDESGIASEVSRENTTMLSELNDVSEIMNFSVHEVRKHRVTDEHGRLQKKRKNFKENEELMEMDLVSEKEFGEVKFQIGIEDSQIYEEEIKQKKKIVEQDEENCRRQEEYSQHKIESLCTLQEEEDTLKQEKEKLYEEKDIFYMEKERFQKEKEILQTEKDSFQGEKDSLQEKLESLTIIQNGQRTKNASLLDDEKDVETKEHLYIHDEERIQKEWGNLKQAQDDLTKVKTSLAEREILLEREKMKLQKEWDKMKQYYECKKNVFLAENEKNLEDTRERMEKEEEEETVYFKEQGNPEVEEANLSGQDLELGEDLKEQAGLELAHLKKQNDLDFAHLKEQNDLDFAHLKEQNDLDLAHVKEQNGLDLESPLKEQNGLDLGAHLKEQKYLDLESHLKKQDDIDLKSHYSEQSLELVKTHKKQDYLELEDAHLKEENLTEKERIEMNLLQTEDDDIAKERTVCEDDNSMIEESSAQPCGLMTNSKIANFSNHEERERLQVEKERLKEEWENFKLAQEELNRKKTALSMLEEDIKTKTESFRQYEEDINIKSQSFRQYEEDINIKSQSFRQYEEDIKMKIESFRQYEEDIKTKTESFRQYEEDIKIKFESFRRLDDEQKRPYQIVDNLKRAEEHVMREQNLVEKREENIQNETEIVLSFEEDRKCFKVEKDRFCREKEKAMFEEMTKKFLKEKDLLQLEKEKLDRNEISEKEIGRFIREKEILQLEKERFDEEKEVLQGERKSIFEEKAILENEIERLHSDKKMLEEYKAIIEKEKERLEKEKEMLQEETGRLELKNVVLQENNILFLEEKENLEKEKKIIEEYKTIIHKETVRLEEEKVVFQENSALILKENKRLEKEKEILEKSKTIIQEETERLKKEKAILQENNTVILKEQERLEKERELLQEGEKIRQIEEEMLQGKRAVFQEEEERCQKDRKIFEEQNKLFKEKQEQLHREKEIFENKKETLQKMHEKLQHEREILQEKENIFQAERHKVLEEAHMLQKEKKVFEDAKQRLQEAEESLREKWNNLKVAHDDLKKNRDELIEQEKYIQSRIERACIVEEERKKFEEESEKLKKTQNDFKQEKESMKKREACLEEKKIKLEKEWEQIKQFHQNLQHDSGILLEREKNLNEERERQQSAWESLRQSQDDLKKEQEAVNQKYTEIEEKIEAIRAHESHTFDSGRGHEDHDNSVSPDYEGVTEKLQQLEDELDYNTLELEKAEQKIDQLQSLITRGKAVLSEKTEMARQANDKVKELEETVHSLKLALEEQSSNLETKSEECEKLKKVQESYRNAVREQDGLKKEVETLMRGRAGDKEYYEDVIRQLKIKLRDSQGAETSFVEQSNRSFQSGPSVDQMRRIIEFENAAKFLELKELRKKVEEQKEKTKNFEDERSQLQAEINKLQLLVENEAIKSEAMRSTANQSALARRRSEEQLDQLRKQLAKVNGQITDDTNADMETKMMRSQLKEKDQLIDELSKTLNKRDMRWNAVALKHKQLIEQNHDSLRIAADLKKANTELTKLRTECAELEKLREDNADLTRLRKEISEIKTAKHSISDELMKLQKENTALKASIDTLKSQLEEQKHQPAHKDSLTEQQQQLQMESQRNLQCLEHSSHEHSQQEQIQHLPSYRSGGAVESFVIAVKDREIRDLKKKLQMVLRQVEQNTISSSQKSVGFDVKEQSETYKHGSWDCLPHKIFLIDEYEWRRSLLLAAVQDIQERLTALF